MVDFGYGVLPDQLLVGHFRSEQQGLRSAVTVGQLVPGPGEGVPEPVRVVAEALRQLPEARIPLQGHVRREHHGGDPRVRIVGVRRDVPGLLVLRGPLVGAAGAGRQLPLEVEQVVEVGGVPRGGRLGPGTLDPAGDHRPALAVAERVLPAEALLLHGRRLGLRTQVIVAGRAVDLAEGVPAGDERDGLLVVHRHAAEGLTDPVRGPLRIRLAVGPLGVHVDQPHLGGAQGLLELVPVVVALLVRQPLLLGAPVGVVGLPSILAAAAEAEGLEAHGLQRDVPGQDDQVGPRELAAVLLLDRPEQATRLVEVRVVGPAVQGREALRPAARAAAAVDGAVGARGVPRHPDEERPVVAVVGRPPVLRRRHHLFEVRLHLGQVEGLERLGVIEVLSHRVEMGRALLEDRKGQLVRPPLLVASGRILDPLVVRSARDRALAEIGLRFRRVLFRHVRDSRNEM